MIIKAKVQTIYGAAYTRRLCKHFAHKIPAVADGNRGTIEFPFGACSIDCDKNYMKISVVLNDPGEADRAEKVVGDHLLRMANKDEPVVSWRREPN